MYETVWENEHRSDGRKDVIVPTDMKRKALHFSNYRAAVLSVTEHTNGIYQITLIKKKTTKEVRKEQSSGKTMRIQWFVCGFSGSM